MAEEAKAKGNAAYSAGNYQEAIRHFTEAISLSPSNHILYSNRSAAYASLSQFTEALSDARRSVELKPDWSKGYARMGVAFMGLNRIFEAYLVYEKGRQHDPNNEFLKSRAEDAWKRVNDPRNSADVAEHCNMVLRGERENLSELWAIKPEQREKKAEAVKEKEAGDAAYLNKDFETAILCYGRAAELDDHDISSLTNRATVYFETGRYEDCIKDCDKAVERGTELGSGFEMVAKAVARALTRKGTAQAKMAKSSKDFEPVFETFQKALREHHNPDTLRMINDAEKAKKELEQREYLNLQIADEEREKGNQLFEEQKYPEAIKHYNEAIKRNPKDHKSYSNRADCYTKLGAMPEGLKDAEICIQLDPTFAKGYSSKGAVLFFMKQYEKALETYQVGFALDPSNAELEDGVRRCAQQIYKASCGDLTLDELIQRQLSQNNFPVVMAEEAKAKGNAAYSAGNFQEAVRHFSEAISLSPSNHILYSNRSAAYSALSQFTKALADARKTVDLNPDWSKGYSRLGSAYLGLHRIADAALAYKKGLYIDPNNQGLKSGFQHVEGRVRDLKSKLDPRFREYMDSPEFTGVVKDIAKSPEYYRTYLEYPRYLHNISQFITFALRVGAGTPGLYDRMCPDEAETCPVRAVDLDDENILRIATRGAVCLEIGRGVGARQLGSVVELWQWPQPEPEAVEVTGEEKEKRERKAEAVKEKEAGIVAYLNKDFENAVLCYSRALELDDKDISLLMNRAAVYLEMGRYEDCIKDCDKVVERGRELASDFKMVAKALTRKGTAQAKMAKTSKDFEPVIATFQKALTEHRDPDTLRRLNDAEKAMKELEQREYLNLQIADEEREKGNQLFEEQKYPEAIKHYNEAIKRNPKDHKSYSNRADCYTKLGAMAEGLKDAEICIQLDPTFAKGYSSKGAVLFFMKEYEKARETYQAGLKLDPSNAEFLDGLSKCVLQIIKASLGDLTLDELKGRQVKGMQDPEIENILTDPVMKQVLSDFQQNPVAAQEHMKNPWVMDKIEKLVSAGIIQEK